LHVTGDTMVSTRSHPRQFPPPDLSPSKHGRSSTEGPEDSMSTSVSVVEKSSSSSSARARGRSVSAWSHTTNLTTLVWLAISLPLVIWDTGYVLGRPYTMTGGKWHAPFYKPYALYATVDYLYGLPAWTRKDGFTGAQGWLNVIETLVYLAYVAIVFSTGKSQGSSILAKRRVVGREGGVAALVGFSAAIMTLSKTVLYWLVLHCAGWEDLKHNDWSTIFWLWIVPNGAWIVASAWMAYDFGGQILSGLEQAAGLPQKKTQ